MMTFRLDVLTCCIFALLCPLVLPVRLWKTLHMDKENQCNGFVRNDDMEEGDVYMVKSDSREGGSPQHRQPVECSISFNFGDRYISVRLVQWFCNEDFSDPFLAVYDDCLTERSKSNTNLLVRYNCTRSLPVVVYSTSTCISLYHYRGHVRYGYYFAVEISAKHEVISFPAGGIAAIIVGCIVIVLVLVKVVCVISGWEEKLPDGRSQQEDQKHMLDTDELAPDAAPPNDNHDSVYLDGQEEERPSSILLSAMDRHYGRSHFDNLSSDEDAASGEYDNIPASWKDRTSWKL